MHSLAEAIELLEQRHPAAPEPPPLVEKRPCYAISLGDPIFDSIRSDYANFDSWFTDSCQRGHREAFVIDGGSSLAGICILKDEDDDEFGDEIVRRIGFESRGDLCIDPVVHRATRDDGEQCG